MHIIKIREYKHILTHTYENTYICIYACMYLCVALMYLLCGEMCLPCNFLVAAMAMCALVVSAVANSQT